MSAPDKISQAVSTAVDALGGRGSRAEDHARNGAPEPAGDAIELLKRDHAEVKALFQEVMSERASALPGKRKTVDRILEALTLHAKIEETIFYPAVQSRTKRDSEDRQDVLEAYEEHAALKDLIRKIKRSSRRDETLRAKVQVLMEMVEHHVEEEENALFSEAKRLLGDQKLRALGAQIAKVKARAEKRSAPAAPARRTAARAKTAKAET